MNTARAAAVSNRRPHAPAEAVMIDVYRIAGMPRPAEPRLEYAAVDVRRAALFYAKVFGPHAGASYLHATRPSLAPAPTTPPAIAVDDIDDALARIWSHGGEVLETPHLDPATGEWVATFTDPAGNVLGLSQRGPRRGTADDDL
jgi:predicted enzyme related to lactoylglutathione lyase